MNKRMFYIVSLLILMALACNSVSSPATGGTPNSASPSAGQTHPQSTPTPLPTSTPPALPVSLNDALGSLNSFEIAVTFNTSGPGANQSSSITNTTDYSQEQDARHIQLISSVTSAGDNSPTDSNLQIYRIGNAMCASTEKDNWTWTNMEPSETEMLELTQNMIGITPLIDHPTFVGAETVNDIPSNHFTFKVSGLGVKSGYVVTINQGDYWVAIDGQYVVKYTLVMETHDGTNTKVLHEEIGINVTQINQPITIAFPDGCLRIQKPTPTP